MSCNGFFLVGHKEFGSFLITDCNGAINKYTKRCSELSVFRKRKIRITMRFHYEGTYWNG
jgi:hypothetical protein